MRMALKRRIAAQLDYVGTEPGDTHGEYGAAQNEQPTDLANGERIALSQICSLGIWDPVILRIETDRALFAVVQKREQLRRNICQTRILSVWMQMKSFDTLRKEKDK